MRCNWDPDHHGVPDGGGIERVICHDGTEVKQWHDFACFNAERVHRNRGARSFCRDHGIDLAQPATCPPPMVVTSGPIVEALARAAAAEQA